MIISVFGFLIGFIFILLINFIILFTPNELKYNIIVYCILNLLTYAFFSLCYFTFVNISVSALRIRLLNELNETESQGITLTEILTRYNSSEIIDRRISKLQGNKQIKNFNQRYYSKKSITLFMVFIKEYLSLVMFKKKSRLNKKR